MDLLHGALLVAAGIAGGCMAAIVGGAAVITFPALLAAGLPPVMATAANTVALTPGLFLAAIYDRSQLPPLDRSFVAVALASIAGAVIGAVLLVLTPERVFSALVPLLLGFATVLFAYAGRISTWLATRGDARRFTHSPAVVLPVSVYGGYFGAGVGVLMLGVLSVGDRRELPLRQCHQEPCDRVEQRHRHRDLCGPRRGVVAGDTADDGGDAGGRSHRRAVGAGDAEPCRAHAGRVRGRVANGRLCLALLVLTLLRQLDEPA